MALLFPFVAMLFFYACARTDRSHTYISRIATALFCCNYAMVWCDWKGDEWKTEEGKNLLQTSWVTYILLFSLRFPVSDLIHYYLLSHHSIIFPPACRFRTHISMLYADTVLIFAPRYIRINYSSNKNNATKMMKIIRSARSIPQNSI